MFFTLIIDIVKIVILGFYGILLLVAVCLLIGRISGVIYDKYQDWKNSKL